MNSISRRKFGKRLVAAATLPLLKPVGALTRTQTTPPTPIPDVIAGYRLTDDDKRLAEKFLSTHEKNMAPLREHTLDNALAPMFGFASPTTNGEKGNAKK